MRVFIKVTGGRGDSNLHCSFRTFVIAAIYENEGRGGKKERRGFSAVGIFASQREILLTYYFTLE